MNTHHSPPPPKPMARSTAIRFASLMAIGMVFASPIAAATIYVSPNGSDLSNTGAPDRPFRSLRTAHDRALPGDTIVLLAGDYPEQLTLTKRVMLTSRDGVAAVGPSTTGQDEIPDGTVPPCTNNLAPVITIPKPVQSVSLAGSASLRAIVTDDGCPRSSTLTVWWNQTSGPRLASIEQSNPYEARARFSWPGTYTFAITASDTEKYSTSTVTVYVYNQAPQVDAGPRIVIDQFQTALLAGTAKDDGLPNPPGLLLVTWSVVSGAGTVTFGDKNSPLTTARFSSPGKYILRLAASDGFITVYDLVTAQVNPGLTWKSTPSKAAQHSGDGVSLTSPPSSPHSPALGPIVVGHDGTVSITINAGIGERIEILRSTDLVNWSSWTNLICTEPAIQVQDTARPGTGSGFYRVRTAEDPVGGAE